MAYANADALVDTDWLAEHLNDPTIRIVDGSSFLPNVPRDAHAEYVEKRIPGAVLVDIEQVCDPNSDLPHMLPSPEDFAAKIGALGIGNDHRVIVYDSQGVRTSPRVWWMFRVFGHDSVSVLDGGLPKWEAEGRPTASGEESPAPASFEAQFRPELVRNLDQMMAISNTPAAQVIDARPAGRFAGTDTEPRPGIPSGHMPGSVNMPVDLLVDPKAGTVLPEDMIRASFDAVDVDTDRQIVTTCGSGVAACTVTLALHLLGKGDAPVYDGSWSEWGAREDTPKKTL